MLQCNSIPNRNPYSAEPSFSLPLAAYTSREKDNFEDDFVPFAVQLALSLVQRASSPSFCNPSADICLFRMNVLSTSIPLGCFLLPHIYSSHRIVPGFTDCALWTKFDFFV